MKIEEFRKKYPAYNFKAKKANKFHAKSVKLDGMNFHSQSEGVVYTELKLQKEQGLIKDFECQVKIPLEAYGKHIFNYYIDFKIIHNNNVIELLEHKGISTDLWKAKWKMLLAKYDNEIKRGEVICSINWNKGYKMASKGTKKLGGRIYHT